MKPGVGRLKSATAEEEGEEQSGGQTEDTGDLDGRPGFVGGIDLEEASGKKHHQLPVPSVFLVENGGDDCLGLLEFRLHGAPRQCDLVGSRKSNHSKTIRQLVNSSFCLVFSFEPARVESRNASWVNARGEIK